MERALSELQQARARAEGLDGVRFSATAPQLGIHALLEQGRTGVEPIVIRRPRHEVEEPLSEPTRDLIPEPTTTWRTRAFRWLSAPTRLARRLWAAMRRAA